MSPCIDFSFLVWNGHKDQHIERLEMLGTKIVQLKLGKKIVELTKYYDQKFN
jgi:hypothetical protein